MFHLPLREGHLTLREGVRRLKETGHLRSADIPLIVRLMENPAFDMPPLSMFQGRVNPEQHDCIHLVLGRGTSMMDEAFTIGFTMGSTKRMSTSATDLFAKVAERIHPSSYRFPPAASRVFRDAVHLATISNCQRLDAVDFSALMDLPLHKIRERLKVEEALLEAYYVIEAQRNPGIPASIRLVN